MCPPTGPALNTLIHKSEGGNHHGCCWSRCAQAQTHLCRRRRVGRKLGEKTVKATTQGNVAALMWAREQFGTELVWGIEDCRNMSARLERDLLGSGQQVG